jgi:hypothetical protein
MLNYHLVIPPHTRTRFKTPRRATGAPAFAPKALRRGLAVALAEAETERAGEAARERACGEVEGRQPLGVIKGDALIWESIQSWRSRER